MKPIITSQGVLVADLPCCTPQTNEQKVVRLSSTSNRTLALRIRPSFDEWGVDLSPAQATDLGNTLIQWAKTGRLEVEG